MNYIALTKQYGSTDNGKLWYVPGGQHCKDLPELYCGADKIQPSLFVEIPSSQGLKRFFVVENPANINGSYYIAYYNTDDKPDKIDRKRVRRLIHESQDAVGIRFDGGVIREV